MPQMDIEGLMRAASERDRAAVVTSGGWSVSHATVFDVSLGLMAAFGDTNGWMRARRIRATVEWVRQSCEADGCPRWLVSLVEQRVQQQLLAGDFPLIAAPAESISESKTTESTAEAAAQRVESPPPSGQVASSPLPLPSDLLRVVAPAPRRVGSPVWWNVATIIGFASVVFSALFSAFLIVLAHVTIVGK